MKSSFVRSGPPDGGAVKGRRAVSSFWKCGTVPLLVGLICAPTCVRASTHRPTGVLQPFTYAQVTLTGGPLGVQASDASAFYLSLSEDNLLNGFRKRAGLPAPGRPMGGWYDPDDFAGAHPFGQYLSALARLYSNTGDVRFQQKVARLVHGFHETLAPDGFFYSSQKVARNWPNYLYDKNCIGMRDAFTLTGNREALVVLNRMTDWAVKNLPRRKDEWYTLPENLYNCFALTHELRYLQMAREYDYSGDYYNLFAAGKNAFTPDRHAYSHVNTLCSAAKAYEVTADERYFRAIENAWKFLTTTQMYASGGWGPRERFVDAGRGELAGSLERIDNDFETPCGSYANVNLDRYLLRFTGDAKYGDNMERVLFNGMLSALPMQPDGRTFYYSDYRSGTKKRYFGAAWPCCSGTYAQITADYPLDVYFHDGGGIYVNLFAPSKVRWGRVTLEQETTFPESDRTTFIVYPSSPAVFTLHVRVPAWTASDPVVALNGHRLRMNAVKGSFLGVRRRWQDGDRLTVSLPMQLRSEAIAPESPERQAHLYGPLLLVALTDKPVLWRSSMPKIKIARRQGHLPLFLSDDGQLTYRPIYQVTEERYTTYASVRSRQ